ncbi:ATP-binding cassette sub-family C member 4 isoform X2 [Aethina tumida]|uniref:ATP-binding cassette sub-family C member 4 isoform X2 n=1 Tax=Aethina tumida TaxID=116153 RepID=UPI0021491172|nr:ATP-binding cassette sub-family C member 4 isoform X2 [Aethina tumida]
MDRPNVKNPVENANIFKRLFFLYTIPIFKKGRKRELNLDDVYGIPESFASKRLGDALEKTKELMSIDEKSVSLKQLLWKHYAKTYLFLGVLQLIVRTSIIVLQPIFLEKFLNYFKDKSAFPKSYAYQYGSALILIGIFQVIYNHNYMQLISEFGIRVRTAFTTLLYRKILVIHENALSEITIGKVTTLLTKDVAIFERVFIFLNDLWIGFFQICVMCYIIYREVHGALFAGLVCLILLTPLQVYMGRKLTSQRISMGKRTDYRIESTQETLSAIKVVKYYTWERFFEDRITGARKEEIKKLRNIYYLKALGLILPVLNHSISFYLLVMTYAWLGHALEAGTVFFIHQCYGSLRSYLQVTIPLGIISISELLASLQRFDQLLGAEERKTAADVNVEEPKIYLNKVAVKIEEKQVLNYVSMKLTSGLNVVTGNYGSGKSTLFKVILKEYSICQGMMDVRGSISYVSEDPWLFPGTIKDNILFGLEYDTARYLEVLKVCALNKEINSMPNGDATLIGDDGINLSNGQKTRIALARACYRNTDIYLLDDCLKGLDSNVSKYIFNECLKGYLATKLVLFVTNNVHYIKQADHKIIMENGTTPTIEKQKQLLDKRITFYMDDVDEDHFNKELRYIQGDEANESDTLLENKEIAHNKLYQEKGKEGTVSWKVYKKYLNFYGGFCIVFIVVLLFVLYQWTTSYSDTLLRDWINVEDEISKLRSNNTTHTIGMGPSKEIERTKIMYIYTVLVFGSAALGIIKSFSHFYFSSVSSEKLHNSLISAVLKSQMQFFYENKVGNVLNRFSKDLSGIDENIPFQIYEVFRGLCLLIGRIVVIATVKVLFLIPSAFVLLKLYFIRMCYIPVGRSLKRLGAATNAPIIGHINASLEGLITIRAYKMENHYKKDFDQHLDVFTSSLYMAQCSSRAFGFYLDLTCQLFLATIIIHFVISNPVKAGDVGLAIIQASALTGMLQWVIRQWSDFESQMTSVERVMEYIGNPPESTHGSIPENWPSVGKIEYRGVMLRYFRKFNYALKDVTFTIEAGKKVGIVGRTGAGKSSIISALFRMYPIEGKILIDGINIAGVKLELVRSSIAIIPQDPVLFAGTIRTNIDPLGKHTDMAIWKTIEKMNLKDLVQSLDCNIVDGGRNYSSGQRQLICLARALVSKNKIIVLDEATANMEPELDDKIQTTIKECFQKCTVLTIAHRLRSVINSDLVMVIEDGAIKEFDEPSVLLKNEKGLFHRMMQNANEQINYFIQ